MENIIIGVTGAYLGVGAVVLWCGRQVAFQHFAVARSIGEPRFKQAVILALTGGLLILVWPFALRWLFDPLERQRADFEREWAGRLAGSREEWAQPPIAPPRGWLDPEEGVDAEEEQRRVDEFRRRYRSRTLITPFGRGVEWVPIDREEDKPGGEG